MLCEAEWNGSFSILNAYFMANNEIFMVNWTYFLVLMNFRISISIHVFKLT